MFFLQFTNDQQQKTHSFLKKTKNIFISSR